MLQSFAFFRLKTDKKLELVKLIISQLNLIPH